MFIFTVNHLVVILFSHELAKNSFDIHRLPCYDMSINIYIFPFHNYTHQTSVARTFSTLHTPHDAKHYQMTIIVLQIPCLALGVWETLFSLWLTSPESASTSSFQSTQPSNIAKEELFLKHEAQKGMSFDLTCFALNSVLMLGIF